MLTIAEMSERTGIHTKTLQRWDREGKLKAQRTNTNRRVYQASDVATATAMLGTGVPQVAGMARVEHRMVNPFDIPAEPDWQCDEANVLHLMYLMQSFGFTQSLFLWKNGLRAMDGLHRAEAARRLDIRSVPADVFDGPETDFWAQRINSAIKHYTVTDERLGAFISECWLSSALYVPLTREEVLRDYRKFGYDINSLSIDDASLVRYSAGRAVWETDFSTHRLSAEHVKRRRAVDPDVAQWFTDKARMWNIEQIDLKHRLLRALGFDIGQSKRIQEIDAKLYLDAAVSFAQRVAILTQAKTHTSVPVDDVLEWTSKIDKAEIDSVPLKEYTSEAQLADLKMREERKEKEERKKQAKAQVAATPVGQHRVARDKLAMFRRQAVAVSSMIDGLSAYLREPTAEYIEVGVGVLEKVHKTFQVIPGWEVPVIDELRQRINQLEEQNQNLLRAKSVSTPPFISLSSLALSSTDLEEMT